MDNAVAIVGLLAGLITIGLFIYTQVRWIRQQQRLRALDALVGLVVGIGLTLLVGLGIWWVRKPDSQASVEAFLIPRTEQNVERILEPKFRLSESIPPGYVVVVAHREAPTNNAIPQDKDPEGRVSLGEYYIPDKPCSLSTEDDDGRTFECDPIYLGSEIMDEPVKVFDIIVVVANPATWGAYSEIIAPNPETNQLPELVPFEVSSTWVAGSMRVQRVQ